jgi:UDP-GlcNAc:undecaprenyl-phosphate/decaprenyl-phosphate GlcNAc-1-phosphate transferase
MHNKLFEILQATSFEILGLFFIIFALSFFWEKIFSYFSLKTYQSKQRLHKNEIPRIAGIIIYIFLSTLAFFSIKSNYLNVILISALPIIIVGGKEDIFHNSSPKLRLMMMILSAGAFIYLLPTKLPEIDLPILNQILDFGFMKEIFFIFSIVVVVNGNNLIDGVNGNLAFSNIFQLISVILLALIVDDEKVIQLSCLLLIPLIVFALFNFPFGKIFCGDTGAYFYGFAVSASIIYLFGKNDQLLSWNAILILSYPSIELLFSFIRKKFFENKSPLKADAKHIHSLIFRYFIKKNSRFNNNSFVTILLMPFILSPLLSYLFYEDIFAIITIIFIVFFIYVMIYFILFNKLSKK